MVQQPEERLFLTPEVAVEGPGQKALRAHHQAKVGIHPASSWGAVKSAAAGRELIEPDRSGQGSLHHERAKRPADGICRVEPLRPIGDIRLVTAEVVKSPAFRVWPEVGNR